MRGHRSPARRARTITLVLALLSSLAAGPRPGGFADFQVNSFVDAVDLAPGDGVCNSAPGGDEPVCTLRAAVQEVNALGGSVPPHVIRLEAGTYVLSLSDRSQGREDDLEVAGSLTSNEAAAINDLDIDVPFRLVGAGQDATFIDGNSQFRVLDIRRGGSVEDLTIQNGFAASDVRGGGGIRTTGVTHLQRVTVQNNEALIQGSPTVSAGGVGGGIDAGGSTTIQESIIRNNRATRLGGGIRAMGGLTIIDSIVEENVAFGASEFLTGAGFTYGSGGGIVAASASPAVPCADVRIISSTISGNVSEAGQGGGLAVSGNLRLTNSTVSGNSSMREGGGIYYRFTVCDRSGGVHSSVFRGTFSTIALNESTRRYTAGLHLDGVVDARVTGMLLARNRDLFGTVVNCGGVVQRLFSNGYNADDGFTCGFRHPTDKVGAYIDFGPLADNGGPTPTHALAPSPIFANPAIDTGGSSGPRTDQRGVVRPQGPAWDIGAFEFEGVFPDPIIEVPIEVPGNITFLDGFVIPIQLGGPGLGSSQINDILPGGVGGTFSVEIAQDGRSAVVRGDQIGLDLSKPSDNPDGGRPVLFSVFVTRPLVGEVELRITSGEIDGKVRYEGTSMWIIKPVQQ